MSQNEQSLKLSAPMQYLYCQNCLSFFASRSCEPVCLFFALRGKLYSRGEKEKKLSYTGSPRYMRSFYLRFRAYAIENWPFLRNLSPNLWVSLVFLYSNSLYTSLIFWSLSLAYNEVCLYFLTKNVRFFTMGKNTRKTK